MNVRGDVAVTSIATGAKVQIAPPDGFLIASGTRNATTGDGDPGCVTAESVILSRRWFMPFVTRYAELAPAQ